MGTNVVQLRTGHPTPEALEISETHLIVCEEAYRVRRV